MIAVVLLAAACGGSEDGGTPRASASATTESGLSGPLTVFAAASLTDAFEEIGSGLTADERDLDLAYNFGASNALVTQIHDGAPADVFASADERNMQKLVDAGLVEAPQVFARNTLEIVVAPGNPKRVRGLSDLARSDLIVVLADPAVPVGSYSKEVLARAGVTVKPRSFELDVKATLAKVISGEADAAIVYASDVRAAAGRADGIVIPDASNVIAVYPIAVVRASAHRDAAVTFVGHLLSAPGQKALAAHGFLAAR